MCDAKVFYFVSIMPETRILFNVLASYDVFSAAVNHKFIPRLSLYSQGIIYYNMELLKNFNIFVIQNIPLKIIQRLIDEKLNSCDCPHCPSRFIIADNHLK
jgi:hypothetical protein